MWAGWFLVRFPRPILVDSLLHRLHLLSPDPAHKPVGAVENLERFRKEIICFFYFHNLFTIETITHLHIKYLNLNTFKISTYEKNVIFPPGKQPNACLPRQILGTPCTSHLVLLFYQASTTKNKSVQCASKQDVWRTATSSFVQTIFNPSSPWAHQGLSNLSTLVDATKKSQRMNKSSQRF